MHRYWFENFFTVYMVNELGERFATVIPATSENVARARAFQAWQGWMIEGITQGITV